jgi:hypothetical protein
LLAVPHRIFTTLRSLIHFELIFVQEERDPLSASTTRRYPPNINCWRSCLFSNICFWHLCGKSDIYSAVALFLSFLFCSTGLHVCSCASAMLLMLLWLYCIIWSQILWDI